MHGRHIKLVSSGQTSSNKNQIRLTLFCFGLGADSFNGNEEFEKVIFPRSEVLVPEDASEGRVKASNIIYLPPFGLATYKMQGDVWVNPTTSDPAQLYELQNNAYSWLRQLGVQHHDYNFFTLQTVVESGMHP